MTDNHDLEQRRARLTPEQRQRLAQRLQTGRGWVKQASTIPRREAGTLACLSFAQRRHWFLWQLDPRSTAYHLGGTLRLKGQLDRRALEAGFQTLVRRHESLRTVFRTDAQGLPEQIIQAAEDQFELTTIDLSDLPAEQRLTQAHAEAINIQATPFDLTQGPLLRVVLIQVEPEEHYLVAVMHHIISDAWSNRLIIDEFAACYRACSQGQSAVLPVLSIQYADYAIWQRNFLEAGEKERQLAYWRSQLGEIHPVLQLPTDHPHLSTGHYRAARHDFVLPSLLMARLQQQMQARGATLFMGLLAGFQALLFRYTGQNDIRVGVPIANRHRLETENLVGCLVNTQVLRSQLDGRMSLNNLLDQVREAALSAQAHQDLPFEQLVETLQPERSLHQHPLFQVMFNHLREDYRALTQLPGLTVDEIELGERGAQFELTLDTLERADGQFSARFTYAAELFEAKTIERLGEHYLRLLEQLAEQPAQCLGDIVLLSEAEQTQLRAWGINAQRYEPVEPVHRLIERQATIRADATALIFNDIELSYAELNRRSNRLAHRLITLGINPESRVGIAVERSVDMIVGLLAVLKAGGAYVPLDPDYPRERLHHMVADSAIELLLTHRAVESRIPPPADGDVLVLDALDLSDEPEDNPTVALHGEHLAYIIYTSGSTGKPKGVAVAHGPLAMHIQAIGECYGMTPDDRELQFASINFDGAHERWLVPLAFGAALMPRDQELWSADRTVAEIVKHHITIACFTPGYLHQLAELTGSAGRDLPIRSYTVGGEAMSRSSYEFVQATLQPPRLINGYGPTETVITPLIFKASPATRFDSGYLPIGTPVGDRTAYILDTDMNPVPCGVTGELYLGGRGLARGYLNRAGLTAERFVADPFDEQGGRLYRTGDLARWRSDGQIEYLGRVDHQVKVRGFRIELGEIETQLLHQPAVREAVVVAREGPAGMRLVAYIALQAGHSIEPGALREALAQTLPDYMLPSAIMVLDSLPLNANGKVDRKCLPEPERLSNDTYREPSTPEAKLLARVWQEVLGVERIGETDNFFALGGDSLSSLKVMARIRSLTDTKLDFRLRDLIQRPTIADLLGLDNQFNLNGLLALNQSCGDDRVKPLFCIHAGMGTVFDYQPLARQMQGMRPVYGIPCRMLADSTHRDTSLYQMAEDYCRMIRFIQPEGPYHLLGWSLGGALAALMAAILEAEQQTVAFLGLIDSYVPGIKLFEQVRDDWRQDFMEFVAAVIPDIKFDESLHAAVFTRTALMKESKEQVMELLEKVYSLNQKDHDVVMGPEEMVHTFMVARYLKMLSLQISTLKPLRAKTICWWAATREYDDRLALERQLNSAEIHSIEIDADHYDILQTESLLLEVEAQLRQISYDSVTSHNFSYCKSGDSKQTVRAE